MRALTMAALALLSFGAVSGMAAEGPPSRASRLTISGGSTVRAWSCSTATIRGGVRTVAGSSGTAIADLPAGTHQVVLTIPVSSIDCRNGTMNGHLRRALREERNPEIRFEMSRYTVSAAGQVSAEGSVTVAGRTTPIRVNATVEPAPEGARATGQVQLRMTQLGVEPPTLMMGTLKVHDPITIEFDVYLAQSEVVALR